MTAMMSQLMETLVLHPLLSVTSVASLATYMYYQRQVVGRPRLHCKPGTNFHKLLDNITLFKEVYRPTLWCWEARMQTILASVMRRSIPDIQYNREIFTFRDGGQVGLDWTCDQGDPDPSQPIVLILPGLTGSSQSEYVKSLVNVAVCELGARCVVFNFRGRGGHTLQTPRTYCAANSDDLKEILDHINHQYTKAPVVATGISLGGMILGNYLACMGDSARSRLVGAMLVSTCFDTFEGNRSLELPGLNLMLNRHLAHCLVDSIREVRHLFESHRSVELDEVMTSRTIREFDTTFTAKVFGYSSVEDYYTDAKLSPKLGLIKVPTLALNAEDDPFQPGASIPTGGAEESSHVAILTTRRGGHIGFMEGILPTTCHYADRVFKQYLAKVFSNIDVLKTYK